MHLSQTEKPFLHLFVQFSNLHQILNIFKNRSPSQLIFFGSYGPRKTWLDKCLKSLVGDDLSTGNMVNGPKY